MVLRLMQVFIPGDPNDSIDELLEGRDVPGQWQDEHGPCRVIQLLLPVEETEPVTDRFEARFGSAEGFHIVLLPIEAVLPRIEEQTEEPEGASENHAKRRRMQIGRVSRGGGGADPRRRRGDHRGNGDRAAAQSQHRPLAGHHARGHATDPDGAAHQTSRASA